jgi:hypothetical protein
MNKKVVGIAMVKDECDIIELFVRINLRHLDHLVLIDHASRDGTREILQALRDEGLPLTLHHHEETDFQQAIFLSRMVRQVAATDTWDFIVPLDADEFIHTSSGHLGDTLAAQIPAGHCGNIAWRTHVPTSQDYYALGAPLYEGFRQRLREPKQFYKVVIPNELGKDCILSEGSHKLASNQQRVPAVAIEPVLQHVPVRSAEQISAKVLLGAHRLSIKPQRIPSQGRHWDNMAERVRASNYRLTPEDARMFALLYACPDTETASLDDVDESAPRIGLPDDIIRLGKMSRINLAQRLDVFARDLCSELLSHRMAQREREGKN